MLVCAVTGGPCGGKSEAMSTLTQALESRGYKVFVIPETPTELIPNGIVPWDKIPGDVFQELVMDKQLSKEELYYKAASYYGDKTVIFCDRGVMDAKAYMSDEIFNKLCKDRGLTIQSIYDRYDSVLHLVTAADGAEEFYQWNDPTKEDTGNNPARSETPEQARVLDKKTLKVWVGHPHLRVFDNSTSFKEKKQRVVKEVFAELGEPVPKEIERKFLIQKPTPEMMSQFEMLSWTNIVQTYLKSNDPSVERRVRQRGTEATGYSFYYTEKTDIGLGERLEHENRIEQADYVAHLADADTSLHQVVKSRCCFVYENQYFELDTYLFSDEYAILEVEVNDIKDGVTLPPFTYIAEVTDDEKYRNRSLAKTQRLELPASMKAI